MAVRTQRAKVTDRIDAVAGLGRRQRHYVVNVNKSIGVSAVCRSEVEGANEASVPVVGQALTSCRGIPFVDVLLDREW